MTSSKYKDVLELARSENDYIWVKRKKKKLATTVYIDWEQNDKLRELNEQTGIPMAGMIRKGIDMYLAKILKVKP